IAVAAEDFLDCGADGNVSFLCVSDRTLTGMNVPLAPGSNNREIRRKSLVSQLEADLIIALSGAAVREPVCTFRKSNFNLAPGQQWPGDSCSEKVRVFVHGARFHHGPEVIGHKFTAQVFNEAFGCAGLYGFIFEAVEFLFLTDVSGHRNDLAPI